MSAAAALGAVAAATPIVVVLVAMLGPRWPAARAGALAFIVAISLCALPLGFTAPPAPNVALPGLAQLVVGAGAEGLFSSTGILWILWPALALHGHQQRHGALAAIERGLLRVSADRPVQLLLVCWFLALFFEGAAGFGAPVALCAPLLVSLGVRPLGAVLAALMGHAVGVSFGALATPLSAIADATGVDAGRVAVRTALLHVPLGGLMMSFVVRALVGAGGEPRVGASVAAWASVCFLVPMAVLAAAVGPELATLGGALVGAALFVGSARLLWLGAPHIGATAPTTDAAGVPAGVGRALLPYALLIVLVLVTRLILPISAALSEVTLGFDLWGAYRGSLKPLLHPGTLLMLALWAGALGQGARSAEVVASLLDAAKRLGPAAVSLVLMLALSRLMVHSGMVDALQQAVVAGLGRGYVLGVPLLGALGSFVTGSATASNVLFATLQRDAAVALGVDETWVLAGQGFGAAVGNIVCPHNIIAGLATVGLVGREAVVLRQTVVPCLLYAVLGGVLLVGALSLGTF